jgi:dTDP-4-dehydrorhamnose reductase
MRILILGNTGMLGHKLYQVLSAVFDVVGTTRGSYSDIRKYGFYEEHGIIPGIDALEIYRVEKAIRKARPDVVINCIGVVKALEKKAGKLLNVWLNSLFPHQLYQLCRAQKARLIHISTDCVFSGKKGNYKEDDPSDAEDIYGKTKYLGEVDEQGALTIRTSFIGRELETANGLLEWFLSNRGGSVDGFSNAIFSGFPTLHLSRIIHDVISDHPDLSGVYHVSSEPISKFKLLSLINEAMKLNIEVKEYPDFHCDRSLDSAKYRGATGFVALPWEQTVAELAEDAEQYGKWR